MRMNTRHVLLSSTILSIILTGPGSAFAGITLDSVAQYWDASLRVVRPMGLILEDEDEFENHAMPLVNKTIHLVTGYGPLYGESWAAQTITSYSGPASLGATVPAMVISGNVIGGSTAGHGSSGLFYRFTLDQPHPYALTGPAYPGLYGFFFLEGSGFSPVGGGSSGTLPPGAYLFQAFTTGMPTNYSLSISAAVPEPSVVGLAACSAALLVGRRGTRSGRNDH